MPTTVETLVQEVAAFHDEAWGWAKSCCLGDASLAEDVLQAAYARAIGGKLSVPECASLKPWWFGVIRFVAQEHRRKVSRHLGLGARVLEHWREWFGSPGELFVADDHTHFLREALAALPRRQREVLHLVFYHDLTIEESAQTMGITLGSARTHYERGKSRLRSALTTAPAPTSPVYVL